MTGDPQETLDSQDCDAGWDGKERSAWALLGLVKKETLPKEVRLGEQNAGSRGEEPGGCDRCIPEVLNCCPEGGLPQSVGTVSSNFLLSLSSSSEQLLRSDCATSV